MPSPSTVALTGATGFIGSHVLRDLLLAGLRVRVLVRSRKRLRLPEQGAPVSLVEGDLLEPGALEDLVRGAGLVVHVAGAVRGADYEDYARVNALGTWRLARAAAREETPPRFLLVSSLAARHPHLSPYAASKRLGEELLRATPGLPWCIFRPPAVYGPGDRELAPLIRSLLRGVAPCPGRGHRFSLIHVCDLSRAILAWVRRPVVGRIYEPHDGREGGYSWPEVAEIAARVRGGPVRLVRVPRGPLEAVARLNRALGRLTGRPPMLTPGKVNELFHPWWVCDGGPLERDLAWKPAWDLERGLRSFLEKV